MTLKSSNSIGKYFLSVVVLFSLGACSGGSDTEETTEAADTTEASAQAEVKSNKVQKLFYTIPSPIEMSMLIKKAGAVYNKEILNPTKNVSNYATNLGKALNLGVYGADLSYTSIFDQTQETMQYLSCAKKLADGLGITSAFSSETVARIEKNINNRDSLLSIISDSYWTSDAYLKENERENTSAFIITGGWIEALYIATKLAGNNKQNAEILNRIAEQKLSLENLISLLKTYENDTDINKMISDLEPLKKIYDGIVLTYAKSETSTDETNKSTTIGNTATMQVTAEQQAGIAREIEILRNNIIK
jgi:hypothetical protein